MRMRDKPAWFNVVNETPDGEVVLELAQSAVNAAAIATRQGWRNAYDALIAAAHEFCVMPTEERCAKRMLELLGFYRQTRPKEKVSPEELCERMNELCWSGAVAVAQLSPGKDGSFIAVRLDDYTGEGENPDPSRRYYCCGEWAPYPHQFVKDVWIRWPDGKDHNSSPRPRKNSRGKKTEFEAPKDHRTFRYCQMNPEGRRIGDCTVRAMSLACGVTWHEALDLLADGTDYANARVNTTETLEVAIKRAGFVRCGVLRKDGRLLKGADFCMAMNRRYHNGERILVYLGRSHIAAVLPEENGEYKILDSWDSTQKYAGAYFVKRSDERERDKVQSA